MVWLWCCAALAGSAYSDAISDLQTARVSLEKQLDSLPSDAPQRTAVSDQIRDLAQQQALLEKKQAEEEGCVLRTPQPIDPVLRQEALEAAQRAETQRMLEAFETHDAVALDLAIEGLESELDALDSDDSVRPVIVERITLAKALRERR